MTEIKPPKSHRSHGKNKAGMDARDLLAQFGVRIHGYRVDPPRHDGNWDAPTVVIPRIEVQR